ncbi:hypothetical protein K5I29_05430 [Flavobacterium agricola]|uniref:Uncharacterized protein n=1 Tax=Flavobacterium agricola TaxID=2870839 RepID=A0ABY6M3C7_9FLAO|nr:hypothetical protein [Flavobacterium agricola]UYW02340.1 hypothetical protein K5I29_05430 [Flavobacterium agricola]
MKNKILLYALPVIQVLTLSCKKDLKMDTETQTDSVTFVDSDLERKIHLRNAKNKKAIFFPDSLNSDIYIQNILKLENELDSLLRKKSSLEANLLYEDYSQELIANLTSFNFTKSDILDNYVNYPPNEIPEEWKKQIEYLKTLGIELVYEGEGYYSFQFKHDYFYQLFKGKVTSDLETFLNNYAEDSKVVFQVDAGIVVPWKEIRKRILRWEKFIIDNPESRYNTTAKEVYAFYLSCYLLGMENTRTYEAKTREIYPEIKNDYLLFISGNPNSFSTELTKEYLEYFDYAAKNLNNDQFEQEIQQHVIDILQETLNYKTN